MRILLFKDISIGTIFHHPSDPGTLFVKIGEAISGIPLSEQRPNTIQLDNLHYVVSGSKFEVCIYKAPEDFDDESYRIVDL